MRWFLALFPALVPFAHAQTGCWDDHADCTHERFEGPSVVIDDLLYVFGGFDSANITVTTAVDVYDPVLDSWSSRADLPSPVTHAGVALDGRTVWMVAGFVGDHPGVATGATWTYDVDLDAWSPGPTLPKAVAGGALVRYERLLHWFGGVEADRDTGSADHFVLDLDNVGAGWSARAPLPQPRNHLSGVKLGSRIHAFGGQFGHDTNPVDSDLHHTYNPTADVWAVGAPLPIPRSHFEPGTIVHDGKAIIVSGKSNPGLSALTDVTEYDPALDAWSALPFLPEARFGVSAKVIQGRLYVTTGGDGDVVPEAVTRSRPVDMTWGGHLRVNCGGPHYVDTTGNDWCSDMGYLNGEVFQNFQVPDVKGTSEDPLYLTHRTNDAQHPGRFTYRLPVDDGKYRLVLHFAEIEHGATGFGGPSVGERVLRVVLEGVSVRANFDVAALVGVETVITQTFDFESKGAAVDLVLLSSVGDPMLAAFELITLPDDAFDFFCTAGPNSTGSPALISFKGSGSLAAGDLRLFAGPLPAGQPGLFFYSKNETNVVFGNGQRCVDTPIVRLPVHVAVGGVLQHTMDFNKLPPNGQIFAGSSWGFQAWYRDPAAGGANYDSSDALRMKFTN